MFSWFCSRGKNLWTDIKNGEQIEFFQARDATQEAEHVVKMIRQFTDRHAHVPLSQIAILYRTNAQCNECILLCCWSSSHFDQW